MRYLIVAILFIGIAYANNDNKLSKYETHGIDVSHYQSQIDWQKVASQNIDFAFVKATEGETMVDSLFEYNWDEINSNNLKRGAYHFFLPTKSSSLQAMNFIENVDMEIGDLPPVLDLEVSSKLSKKAIISRATTWLQIIEEHYKIKPIIYTNQKFFFKYIEGAFDDYPIWIARYGKLPPRLSAGKDWAFWQHGDKGKVEGIKGMVDINVFNGSSKELEAMCFRPAPILSAK